MATYYMWQLDATWAHIPMVIWHLCTFCIDVLIEYQTTNGLKLEHK